MISAAARWSASVGSCVLITGTGQSGSVPVMAERTLTPPFRTAVRAPATTGERRAAVRDRIETAGLDALIVLDLADIRYLSGFTGSSGLLVLLADEADAFLTDFRYKSQVAQELDSELDVRIESEGLLKVCRELLAERGAARVGFQREQLSYRAWSEWSDRGPPDLVPVEEWIEELRMIKSAPEIAAIRKACRIADETFESMLEHVRPGVTERELAARLNLELAARGADGPSFETIVASGPRAARAHRADSLPGGAGPRGARRGGPRGGGRLRDVNRL